MVFLVGIRIDRQGYIVVLDTTATISMVRKKNLPLGVLKNTMPTAAIRMEDGHVVHSQGDYKVHVPMRCRSSAQKFCVMDTEAFNFFLAIDFFAEHQ